MTLASATTLIAARGIRVTRRSVALFALLVLGVSGCSTVRPPQTHTITPKDAARVYVLHSYTHAALAIPTNGIYVAWGFGDQASMVSKGIYNTLVRGSLLVFTGVFGRWRDGALERVPLRAREQKEIAAETGMSAQLLIVDQRLVDQLSAELNEEFARGKPLGKGDFVHDSTNTYSTVWYSCGDAVADWCRQLGAEVPPCPARWLWWTVKVPNAADPSSPPATEEHTVVRSKEIGL